jgi:hypothetical protein
VEAWPAAEGGRATRKAFPEPLPLGPIYCVDIGLFLVLGRMFIARFTDARRCAVRVAAPAV